MSDTSAIVYAWNEGKLVITAKLLEGPQAGRDVICITSREEFITDVLPGMKKHVKRRSFMRSLKAAIHDQVHAGLANLTPSTEANFMSDLTLLMAAQVVRDDESVTDGTGLFSILLAVNPDVTQPWHQRGLLKEEDVTAHMQGG